MPKDDSQNDDQQPDERPNTPALPTNISSNAPRQGSQRRALRKRSVSRQRRRFESTLSQLDFADRFHQVALVSSRLGGSGWNRSKILSSALLLAVLIAGSQLLVQDMWFVYAEDVEFGNLTYLDPVELYQRSRVDGWNILWLKPEEIRDRLITHPYIEDVQVGIGVPTRVSINLMETQPVALWITKDETYWLTPTGAALSAQGQIDQGLPEIFDLLGVAQAHDESDAGMDPAVLKSALTLMETLPKLDNRVRYDPNIGLNFRLPEHPVWVYWGNGEEMGQKLAGLNAVEEILSSDEVAAQYFDVRQPLRPYLH